MFLTSKLVILGVAFLIETTLRNATRTDRKPDMIRLVFAPDILTKCRIGLNVPPVVVVPLDPLDSCPALSGHVALDKILEPFDVDRITPRKLFRIAPLDPDRKES